MKNDVKYFPFASQDELLLPTTSARREGIRTSTARPDPHHSNDFSKATPQLTWQFQ